LKKLRNMNAIKKSSVILAMMLQACTLFAPAQTAIKKDVIPDYSTTARSEIPVEYTWNTQDMYASADAWKLDKEQLTTMVTKIEAGSKDWTSSSKKMLAMLQLRDKIWLTATKLWSYAGKQYDVDMGNTTYQAMKGELQSAFVKLSSALVFMNPDILELGADKFKEYLKEEPALDTYKFSIEDILRSKDHILPDDQQKIVTLTGLYSSAISNASDLLNDLDMPAPEVTIDTQTVTLNWANFVYYRASDKQDVRRKVYKAFFENQKKYENTLATLLDGGIKQDYFSSQVYKYSDCLASRLYADSIPAAVYDTLISSVRNNLEPLHRYLLLKKKLLKLTDFYYEDVYASSVPSVEKTYTYDDAKEIILKMAEPLGKDYLAMLNIAFNNRWIDIYPNKGKESGAYSGDVYGVHPYIKMNFNGKYDALSTLAHELGHAMHSYLTDQNQSFTNSGYPTFLAEIASTFNENLLMHYLLKSETDDLFKLYILDNYIEQVRGTLFHQAMFAEFDLAIHKRAEEGQSLTAEWLDEEYLKLLRFYYGHDKDVCKVEDYTSCGWSRISHFYRNYYVFQYSTGIIASLALSDIVLNGGEKERTQYIDLLKAGGNGYPITLLKKAGVDMTSSKPYAAAIKQVSLMVDQMEILVNKLQKEGKL
jgi:oligoendopeptidase F